MDTPAGTVTKPDERKDAVESTPAATKTETNGATNGHSNGVNGHSNGVNGHGAKSEGSEAKPLGSYPSSGIDVLIVGTGLAGLTAAIECTRKGHSVRVLERNSTINTAGPFFSYLRQSNES